MLYELVMCFPQVKDEEEEEAAQVWTTLNPEQHLHIPFSPVTCLNTSHRAFLKHSCVKNTINIIIIIIIIIHPDVIIVFGSCFQENDSISLNIKQMRTIIDPNQQMTIGLK